MRLESWMSLASLGLSVMFVALTLSFYNFLIGPDGQGPQRVVEPGSLLLQLIFISGGPSLVLAGFVFGMSKTFGSRMGGMMLVGAGVVMAAGMAVGTTMLLKIDDQYMVGIMPYAPYFFLATGAGVAAVGSYLLAISGRRARYSNLDDLR
ncbi:MAG TPA: hypothetical protein VJP79_04310 [Nitrososphaera sp.]|nr:hypothetical protein [Nitrososphaera sp.]